MDIDYNNFEGILKIIAERPNTYVVYDNNKFSLIENKQNKTPIDVVAEKIDEAIKEHDFKNDSLQQLDSLTKGMETLKTRITDFKSSIFFVKRFFLWLFGSFTPLNLALNKLQHAIDKVESEKTKIKAEEQVAGLEREIANLKREEAGLPQLRERLRIVNADIERNPAVETKIPADKASLAQLSKDRTSLAGILAEVEVANTEVNNNMGYFHRATGLARQESPQLIAARQKLEAAKQKLEVGSVELACNKLEQLELQIETLEENIRTDERFVAGHEQRLAQQKELLEQIQAVGERVAIIASKTDALEKLKSAQQ